MQVSQEELADTQRLLARMERAAKSRGSKRWIVVAASMVYLGLGVWGLVTLFGADAYASARLAESPEVSPAILAAGLEWVKHWVVFMLVIVSALVTGGLLLAMAISPWKPRTLDPVLAMLLRDYLARAQIAPVAPLADPPDAACPTANSQQPTVNPPA